MSVKGDEQSIVIVKRRRKGGKPHSGGSWKVAYADFITAMMAFFIVMWLITIVPKEKRLVIFAYFNNPSVLPGKSIGTSIVASTNTSPVALIPRINPAPTLDQAREITETADRKKLESLMQELRAAINEGQALKPYKDQFLLDIAPEGLRIQIVDAQNRPMFNLGSARLQPYVAAILHELAPYLNTVPNRITLAGHTDTTPYVGQAGYNNWDLSADRANAARRALEGGGLSPEKLARVSGLSSSVPFDQENARNPVNRRISIIVMTKEAEATARKTDSATGVRASDLPSATHIAAERAPAGPARPVISLPPVPVIPSTATVSGPPEGSATKVP